MGPFWRSSHFLRAVTRKYQEIGGLVYGRDFWTEFSWGKLGMEKVMYDPRGQTEKANREFEGAQ
jgi:hypothetical protein